MERDEEKLCRSCRKQARFLCQDCDYYLCRLCKIRHLKYRSADEHSIVQLKGHRDETIDERCQVHKGKFMELFCKKCLLPVCSTCVTENHNGHIFGSFSDIYVTAVEFIKEKISKIRKELLPKCAATLQELQKKERTVETQIQRLNETVNEYENSLNDNPTELISFYRACTADDENISLPDIQTPKEKMKLQKLYRTSHLDQYIRFTNAVQNRPPNSTYSSPRPGRLDDSTVVNNEITVPVVKSAHHISCTEDGHVWVSDNLGTLVLMDIRGNSLKKLTTSGWDEGFHSVTTKGELIYSDKANKCVRKVTTNNEVQTVLKTGFWKPTCVFSSPKNMDIFVGMVSDQNAKIGRFDRKGNPLFDIHTDSRGEALLKYPLYLTENKNSDICISDVNKHAVVVLDKMGQHRFSYKGGDNGGFWPHGISTDDQGHILICNSYYSNPSVQMIDENGVFLYVILAQKHGLRKPRGLCVDNQQRLWVGQWHENKVCVYKITV